MHKITEQYLNMLNEQNSLNDMVEKMLVIFGFGKPKDPKIKAIASAQWRCERACYRAYGKTRETTTRQPSQQKGNDPTQTTDEITTIIRENPDLGKCLALCYYDAVSSYVRVIKQNQDTICDKNKYKSMCEKWIDKYLPELEADLEAMKNTIEMIKGRGLSGDSSKVQVVINKLKKIL